MTILQWLDVLDGGCGHVPYAYICEDCARALGTALRSLISLMREHAAVRAELERLQADVSNVERANLVLCQVVAGE